MTDDQMYLARLVRILRKAWDRRVLFEIPLELKPENKPVYCDMLYDKESMRTARLNVGYQSIYNHIFCLINCGECEREELSPEKIHSLLVEAEGFLSLIA